MSDSTGLGRRVSVETHYEQAKQELEALARRLADEGAARLPAEDRLTREIGFSRPTVRSALLALQMEGKVLRVHGVGTFINRHALDIRANLAEDAPFLSVIERFGHEPTLDIVRLAEEPLPPKVCARAGVPDDTVGIVIDRLYRASGEPAVLSRDYVPADHLTRSASEVTAERSTFAFMRRWTGRVVRYSVASIHAVNAPQHVADMLGVASESAVLVLDHDHVDEGDEVVGATEAFVRDDLIRFSIVRTSTDL